MMRNDAKTIERMTDNELDAIKKFDGSDEYLNALRRTINHLDPTDEQLALDAGRFVVEFFGQSGDTVALDEAAARAAYLYEQRITHSILAWDRVILGYFAGRLGSDWAKGDS